MENKILKTSLITILLLLSLTFNIFLVQADAVGTGKFLQINFIDAGTNCYVTATKSSGQVFTFFANNTETYRQKVGAGTVLLEAFINGDSWCTFSHFESEGDIILNEDKTATYQTEKYGEVDAIFKPITFNIEVYVVDGLGEILLEVEGGAILVADENNDINHPALVPIEYGTTPTFEFIPDQFNHLSSVLVDETSYIDLVLTEFTKTYQFTAPIKEDGHSLAITFSPDGLAIIPSGSDVTVFLSDAASLTFGTVGDGTAYGEEIFILAPGDLVAWEITVEANLGDQVIVALKYDDPPPGTNENNLRLYRIDVNDYELYLKCDFNDDGIVNGQDVKVIANIVKLPKFLPDNPEDYDLNGDNILDENDIHIVNSMKNTELVDITLYVDEFNNIIYGITDHFSVFKCR